MELQPYKWAFWILIIALVVSVVFSIFNQSKLNLAIREIRAAKEKIDSAKAGLVNMEKMVNGLRIQTEAFELALQQFRQQSKTVDSLILLKEKDVMYKLSGIQQQVSQLQNQRKDLHKLLKDIPRTIETKPLIPTKQ